MADGVGEQSELLPALTSSENTTETQRRRHFPQARRFRIAVVMLAGVAICAVAIAIAVAARGSHRTPPVSWSAWTPSSSGSTGAQEIAEHVAPYYRVSTAQQLDVIQPIALTDASDAGVITGSGLTVAVNSGSSSSASSLELLSGKTVAYDVCGVGGKSDCALPGTPSSSRLLLLRREALEMALYTLEYISGTANVVIVLPPGRTTATSTSSTSSSSSKAVTVAVLFDRQELKPWLDVPLTQTLAEYPPDTTELAAWSKTTEAGLVDQITAESLFSESIESEQEGGRLLVLTQLPSQ